MISIAAGQVSLINPSSSGASTSISANGGTAVTDGTINSFIVEDASGNVAALAGGNNRIPFWGATGIPASSSDLTYVDSTKLLTVGSGSGTSAGWTLGYFGTSANSGMWPTSVTASGSNYILNGNGNNSSVNGGSNLFLQVAAVTKMSFANTAGAGPSITTGTATTAVSPLSTTQALNAVGVSFPGVVHAFTGGATAAAGTNLFDVTLDAVHMMTLTKAGNLDFAGTLPTITSNTNNAGIVINVIGASANLDLYKNSGLQARLISGGFAFTGGVNTGISAASGTPATLLVGNGTAGNASGTLQCASVETSNTNFMVVKTGTLAAGATGNVPTLTAGPVTGNPTKWVAINDNGTTRYIPAW